MMLVVRHMVVCRRLVTGSNQGTCMCPHSISQVYQLLRCHFITEEIRGAHKEWKDVLTQSGKKLEGEV